MKLEIQDLSHFYPRSAGGEIPVLCNLDFSISAGEFAVILGPSGCGKTTLLRILAGLEIATEGRVLLNGHPVQEPGRQVGLVFQQPSLFPWLTVFENVAFGLRLTDEALSTTQDVVARYLDLMQLQDFGGAFPRELSVGMQQRVAIARSLAATPDVILLDEPFSALDVRTRSGMQSLLLHVRKATRMTTIFVTHSVEEGVFLADRIIVLSARPARVIYDGRIELGPERTEDLKRSLHFLKIEAELTRLLRENL